MKFSIVITTYNRLDLLQRAIDSAINQTIYCEVIVVDDCSSDGTLEYMERLSEEFLGREDSSLVYIRNAVNLGHAATVNAGVNKASGDWIKFLDDDDYLAPNCLAEMTEAIALHPEAVICSCIAAQVDEQEIEISRTPLSGPGSAFYIPQADIHYGMLLECIPFGTPVQVACRRDAFLQTGGWDTKLDTNCDDIDSWIRIAEFGDAIFLNQCLAYRTIWGGAGNQKFSLLQRLNTNILMKEKIYYLIDDKYRTKAPHLQDIKNYLKLHWVLVALKRRQIKKFFDLFDLVDTSVLSLTAWRLLFLVALTRRGHRDVTDIRKYVLIDTPS